MDEVLDELTPKELEVIKAIEQGYISDIDIGKKLCISKNTAACHVQKIFGKLKIYDKNKRATLVYMILARRIAEIMKECLEMGIKI